MKVVNCAAMQCKVVLEDADLPEGAEVTVLVRELGSHGLLPADLQAELEDALDEADRTEGISGTDLFDQLKKYG